MTGYIPPNLQEDDPEPPQKAAVALNFIVVGAGLGGLVAAIALQDAGHTVLVLDSRSKAGVLSETNGESFYVGPNIHRILTRCGVVLPKQETWQAGLTSLRRCSCIIHC
jgi:2-polyprenyl-6-methoxyphenol hydroxylase-like FAD-dependent oxidoreductase